MLHSRSFLQGGSSLFVIESSTKSFQLPRTGLTGKSTFSNGIVLRGSRSDGTPIAIKCIDADTCSSSFLVLLQREAALSRTILHPNINVFSSVWLSGSKLCMLSPLMEYGSCADIMSVHFKYGFPEVVIALILQETVKALHYLHGMNLVHRGVRCSHILMSKNGEVKLAGHRNAIELARDGVRVRKVHDFPKHDSSMLPWLSPEILQQDMQGYCAKSDIYSLGIAACELANGHAPFTDMPNTQMLLEKLNGTVPFLLDKTTVAPLDDESTGEQSESPTVNPGNEVSQRCMIQAARCRRFSPILHRLVTDCLEREPENRMNAEELLRHPLFKQLRGRTNMEMLKPVFGRLEPIGVDTSICRYPQEPEVLEELGGMSLCDIEWLF